VSIDKIIEIFNQEFGIVSEKFRINNIALTEAAESTIEYVANPGVYVFWRPQRVIKVGRHLTNARKRALEHLGANTGGSMAALADDPDVRLVLFSLINQDDKHWAAAVEIFLEGALDPEVRSGRLG
jgi:hypothetical protein